MGRVLGDKNTLKSIAIKKYRYSECDNLKCLCSGDDIKMYEVIYLYKLRNKSYQKTHYQCRCICGLSARQSTYYINDNGYTNECLINNKIIQEKALKEAYSDMSLLLKAMNFAAGIGAQISTFCIDGSLEEINNRFIKVHKALDEVKDVQYNVAHAKFKALDQQLRQIDTHFHNGLEKCDQTIVNMVKEQTDKRIDQIIQEARKNKLLASDQKDIFTVHKNVKKLDKKS